MSKTNKSFTKRLRVTPSGKILARQAGKNHFNAKASRKSQRAKNGSVIFVMDAKAIARNMPTSF